MHDVLIYPALALLVIAFFWVRSIASSRRRTRTRLQKAMRTHAASSTMLRTTTRHHSLRQEMRSDESASASGKRFESGVKKQR